MSADAASKTGRKDPSWLRVGRTDVQWRLTWVFLGMLAISVGIGYVLHALGVVDIPWSLLIAIPILLTFIGGTGYAYRRGVQDGRSHRADFDE